jgi:ribonuclease J
MKVCIHRGASEIGGSCVELAADGARLLLDLGRPLTAAPDADLPLPDVAGLRGEESDLLGVVLSHAHLDHYGLLTEVPATVSVFAGQATAAILREAAFFSPAGIELRVADVLRHGQALHIGPFTVTPVLADHSAFDAYSLVIEAGGRRLIYTGDLRAHGRKRTFERMLAQPPTVDVALLEGTQLGRHPSADHRLTEDDVETELARLASETEGALLVFSSAQNIDRLVSVYRACRRTGRTLVIDLYAATIARATGRSTIPQPGFPALRVYVPQRQRVLVKDSRQFERVESIRGVRVFAEEIATDPGAFCLLIQPSTLRELVRGGCLDAATAVWSMWGGYLAEPSGDRLRAGLDAARIPLHQIHASGHATVDDLQGLAAALDPARIVPIHTAAPEAYSEISNRVERHPDGEWWQA